MSRNISKKKIPVDIFGNISKFKIGFTSDMIERNNQLPIEFGCEMELLFFTKIDGEYVEKALIKNIKEKFPNYIIMKYKKSSGYYSTEIFFANPEILNFIFCELKKQKIYIEVEKTKQQVEKTKQLEITEKEKTKQLEITEKEKTEQEKEKTEQEKEKTEQEKEKTKQLEIIEREKTKQLEITEKEKTKRLEMKLEIIKLEMRKLELGIK